MRTGISLTVTPAIRRHLKAVAANRNSPQKHVWRAQIVLLSAAGVGTNEIMRQTGKSKTCVGLAIWNSRKNIPAKVAFLYDEQARGPLALLAPGIFQAPVHPNGSAT